MKVKYVGPSDAVVITVNGVEVEAKRNHQIEVPDAVAGRPPDPRLEEAMLEHRAAVLASDHNWARQLEDEITRLDYGEGLLAQDIWQAVEKKKDGDK